MHFFRPFHSFDNLSRHNLRIYGKPTENFYSHVVSTLDNKVGKLYCINFCTDSYIL